MRDINIMRAHSSSSRRAQTTHNTLREGVQLGLIVGVATWLWVAGLDVIAGEPFQTFQLLNGIIVVTIVHFALCLAYGLTIIGVIHASMKEPTVMFAVIFCTILFQGAFVMFTALLANVGLGDVAWGKFFAGNVMAAVLTYVLVNRHHSMRALYHAAEAHQKD
jgi:hypothetical protein